MNFVNMLKFISIDSTLNSLVITSNLQKKKTIRIKNYYKSDNFPQDLQKILAKNEINFLQIDLILVNLGPGSYASIRNILSSLKIFSIIFGIKLLGYTNKSISKIFCANRKLKNLTILSIGNKFINLNSNKVLKIEEFKDILFKKKVVSNFKYNGTFNNNLVSFDYNIDDIEILLQKKIFIEKNITPKY